MEFHFEKIPRNRLGTASVVPQKKVLIQRHSEFYGRVCYEARNGRKWHEKKFLTKHPAPANRIDSMFSSEKCLGTEFLVVFLFRGVVQNGVPSVCF